MAPPYALPTAAAAFLEREVARRSSILALDYDGTLAPFHVDRARAVPRPAVRALLQALARAPGTRLVVVSGRPLAELRALLALEPMPELWGAHGWEHLEPGGRCETARPAPDVATALDEAERNVRAAVPVERVERKVASVAIHWRGLNDAQAAETRAAAAAMWADLAARGSLTIREFDGGLELRTPGHDKGTVVADLLAHAGDDTPIAYVGDDDTDEDAFRALRGRQRALAVRAGQTRATAAAVTIPNTAVAALLRGWLAATTQVTVQAT